SSLGPAATAGDRPGGRTGEVGAAGGRSVDSPSPVRENMRAKRRAVAVGGGGQAPGVGGVRPGAGQRAGVGRRAGGGAAGGGGGGRGLRGRSVMGGAAG